jgi:hypothetical protein
MLEEATNQQVLQELLPDGSAPPLRVAGPPASKQQRIKEPDSASLERFPLLHGGSVDVPKDVLRDPIRRRELIESLDELSKRLRDTEGGTETD